MRQPDDYGTDDIDYNNDKFEEGGAEKKSSDTAHCDKKVCLSTNIFLKLGRLLVTKKTAAKVTIDADFELCS